MIALIGQIGSIRVAERWIVVGILCYFGFAQLLLWRFLGAFSTTIFIAGAALLCVLCMGAAHAMRGVVGNPPTMTRLAACGAVALVLIVLGGEGRFFYSNIDWQARDAILRDMAINPWPFVYTAREAPDVLRGPIGMFFAPALFYKAFGPFVGELSLLIQNAVLLTGIFGLGSTLFDTRRTRLIALLIFIAFSGMDMIGQLIVEDQLVGHLEGWAGLQFSSNLTQVFWVPHYAIAGWFGAVFFLLWRRRALPLGVMLAFIPLMAIWSPLSMLGVLPFAAFAASITFARRSLTARDLLLPAAATVLFAPTMMYLAVASDAVGVRFVAPNPELYLLFLFLEAFCFIIPLALALNRLRDGRSVLALVALCLLVAPLIQIGESVDFTMRASIPALAVLSILVAEVLSAPAPPRMPLVRSWIIATLAIGSVTPVFEIWRALSEPPSPRGACSFPKAWDQSFSDYGKDTYLAPLNEMPAWLRPSAPARADADEPTDCWTRPWHRPSGL